MGRLTDAWQALRGHPTWELELARMRAEWASLMLSVADFIEILDKKVGRANVAKRRDRKKAEDEPQAPQSPVGDTRWAQKAALRNRRLGRAATPTQPVEEPVEEAK